MLKSLLIVFIIGLSVSGFAQTKDNVACRELYDAQKFEEAYDCYSKDENEIFSVYMSAYLANFLGYKKEFKHWSKRLYSDAFNSSETYYYGAHLHPLSSKKFLKTLNKGLKKFENDTLLLIEKVNYFIEVEDYEEGIPILEQLIELQENDIVLYITAANIYNWVSKEQKAIPYYEKVLALEEDNYDANYGLGIIYYNRAAGVLQEATDSPSNEAFDRLTKEGVSLLQKALPFLEKAYKSTPDNKELKSALLTCYLKLEMDDEYKELKNS